jgi:hypothetical protein
MKGRNCSPRCGHHWYTDTCFERGSLRCAMSQAGNELADRARHEQRSVFGLRRRVLRVTLRTKNDVGGSSRSPATFACYFLRQSPIFRDFVHSLVALRLPLGATFACCEHLLRYRRPMCKCWTDCTKQQVAHLMSAIAVGTADGPPSEAIRKRPSPLSRSPRRGTPSAELLFPCLPDGANRAHRALLRARLRKRLVLAGQVEPLPDVDQRLGERVDHAVVVTGRRRDA